MTLMTPSLCLTTITVRDPHFDAVVRLFDAYRQFYGRRTDLGLARRFLTERLRQQQSILWLALWDREPVAMAQVYPGWSSVSCAAVDRLNDLYVQPRARGLGVGRALVQAILQSARGRGVRAVVLETSPDNGQAQNLYRQLGFVRDEGFWTFSHALEDLGVRA